MTAKFYKKKNNTCMNAIYDNIKEWFRWKIDWEPKKKESTLKKDW